MRIISKFRDYYDSAQGYGLDPNLIYHRINSRVDTIDIKALEKYKHQLHEEFYTANKLFKGENTSSISTERCLICFCGFLYPVVVTKRCINSGEIGRRIDKKYAYSEEDAIKDLSKIGYKEAKKRSRFHKSYWYWYDRGEGMEFFERKESEELMQFSIENKYLSFVLEEGEKNEMKMTLNPCLKNYGFQKIFDSYAAFQEISMFLGGVLGSEAAPMVQIEDKYIQEGHGFDEWSFKTLPTKGTKLKGTKLKKR